MAMKVTLWCDLCPTLLDLEAFEVEFKTKQILPRQDHTYNTQRLHLCGDCHDKLLGQVRPIKQLVKVTAQIEPAGNGSRHGKATR